METSGVAEPESLALSIADSGFLLHAVIVVMDAESGKDTLMGQEVARHQLSAADVVVISKCDLVGLGQVRLPSIKSS